MGGVLRLRERRRHHEYHKRPRRNPNEESLGGGRLPDGALGEQVLKSVRKVVLLVVLQLGLQLADVPYRREHELELRAAFIGADETAQGGLNLNMQH